MGGAVPQGPPRPHGKASWCSRPVCAPLFFHPFSLQSLMPLPSLSATWWNVYPGFSCFYCKILLLNISRPFLPCAFSPHLPRMPLDRVHPTDNAEGGGVADVLKSRTSVQRDLKETWGFGQQKLPEAQQQDVQSPELRAGKPHCIDPGWKPTG